jgi:hypothetical protein
LRQGRMASPLLLQTGECYNKWENHGKSEIQAVLQST